MAVIRIVHLAVAVAVAVLAVVIVWRITEPSAFKDRLRADPGGVVRCLTPPFDDWPQCLP